GSRRLAIAAVDSPTPPLQTISTRMNSPRLLDLDDRRDGRSSDSHTPDANRRAIRLFWRNERAPAGS
ncbi:MAG TPA: hypothetical protein VIT93_06480, partial [Dehalococcoidia bacterium]